MVGDNEELPPRRRGRIPLDPVKGSMEHFKYRELPDKVLLLKELAKKLGMTPSQCMRDALSEYLIKHRMIL